MKKYHVIQYDILNKKSATLSIHSNYKKAFKTLQHEEYIRNDNHYNDYIIIRKKEDKRICK
jgi:hypothetical protein